MHCGTNAVARWLHSVGRSSDRFAQAQHRFQCIWDGYSPREPRRVSLVGAILRLEPSRIGYQRNSVAHDCSIVHASELEKRILALEGRWAAACQRR
jgi:hypothetical protein